MKRLKSLSIVFIIMIGCNRPTVKFINEANGKVIERQFNKDGTLSRETEVVLQNSTYIPDGFEKDYFPSGKLKKLSYKINGRDTGNYYTFYSSGSIDTMNIEKTKTFYAIKFNELGNRIGDDLRFQLKHMDTTTVGNPIPIIIDAVYYGRMNTRVRQTLFDLNKNILWDSTFDKTCDGTLCGASIYYPNLILAKPGVYLFKCSETYFDLFTKEMIHEEFDSTTFYAK